MIKEYLSLYFSSYLYACVFLLPLVAFYIYGLIRKIDLKTLLWTHKTLVLASVLLPAFIVWYSGISFKAPLSTKLELKNSINAEPLTVQPFAAEMHEVPVTKDMVYFISDLAILFSLLGIATLLLRLAIQSFRLQRLRSNCAEETMHKNVKIIKSQSIHSPFAIGFFKKRIFLPVDMSIGEREIAIKHELNHFRLNHPMWSLLETFLSHVFWYNPIVHILKRNGNILREFECDETTLKDVDQFDYGRALLSAAEAQLKQKQPLLAHSWVEKSVLKKRIEFILGERKSKQRLLINSLFATSFALSLTFFIVKGNINDEFLESEIYQKIKRDHAEIMLKRNPVYIDKVPSHFIKALLVHEDGGFYTHDGVSLKGVLRASATNLKSVLAGGPKYVAGGSTITQQLAKSFLKEEKSLRRKFRELKVARVLEKNFTKKEILEMYLNRVYFGNGAWGLADGSLAYYKKNYEQLTLEESAMLIPFLEAPAIYNFLANSKVANQRKNILLNKVNK